MITDRKEVIVKVYKEYGLAAAAVAAGLIAGLALLRRLKK